MAVKLHYKTYGSGEPLLILHGFLGSLDNWHTLAGKFGNKYQVFAIDLRNHGKSPHTSHHGIAAMVEDLWTFMDDHKLPKAALLGHSMGGKVAMQFSLKYPERVTKLIVVDIAPRKYERGHDDVFSALFSVDLNKVQNRKEAEGAMMKYVEDFGTRQFLLKNLERKEEGGFSWKVNLEVLHQDYAEVTGAITSDKIFSGPVLVIRGGNSRYIQESDERDFKKLFPMATIETIEGAGHWVHADKPEELLAIVTDFIKK